MFCFCKVLSSVLFLNLVTQVFSPFALNGLDKDLSILLIFQKKKKEEGTIPKSLDEARFALIWKTKASQEKNITKHFLWLCIQKSSIKY